MPVRSMDSLATTEALAEIFSDGSVLQSMLHFEIALARAEARLGIIPARRPKRLPQSRRTTLTPLHWQARPCARALRGFRLPRH